MTTQNSRDENDSQVFRRVGLLTILWILFLVAAGVALIVMGDALFDLVN